MRAVHIAIGNDNDLLPQQQWALFVSRVRYHISTYCTFAQVALLGEWHSPTDATGQSVCWAVELSDDPGRVVGLREVLAACGGRFQRDNGITWGASDLEILQEEVPVW